MIDYLYDGTFEGLLTCIYYHYYKEKASKICPASEYQTDFFSKHVKVQTDFSLFRKVYDAIAQKISVQTLSNVYYVFLSNHPDKENLILSYLVCGFERGRQIDSDYSLPAVYEMQKYAKRVVKEAHRFLGLVRFSEISGFLYSCIEPDNDILELIADHFSDRYRKEKFIIHDKKRSKAVFCKNSRWCIGDFKFQKQLKFSETELFYRNLWKKYFIEIAVSERKNPKLQSQFMPKKYWKNLIETN